MSDNSADAGSNPAAAGSRQPRPAPRMVRDEDDLPLDPDSRSRSREVAADRFFALDDPRSDGGATADATDPDDPVGAAGSRAGESGDGATRAGGPGDGATRAGESGDGATRAGGPGDGGGPDASASAGTQTSADQHAATIDHAAQQPGGPDGDRKTARKKKKWPFWIELPVLIVIAFVLTFLIQTFIAKVYYVPSGSMEQTLHGASSGGDRILANKIVYDFRDPEQGEVVVFSGPPSWAPEARIAGPSNWFGSVMQSLGSVVGIAPPNEKDYVKRVIAVGGQTVSCCDEAGRVMVDGRPLDEPYIYEPIPFESGNFDCDSVPMSRRCFGPVTVPEGQVWVMGDHRSDSADSSYGCQGLQADSGARCQGPIPVENVIGKAIFIVMPPSRWGTIDAPDIAPGP